MLISYNICCIDPTLSPASRLRLIIARAGGGSSSIDIKSNYNNPSPRLRARVNKKKKNVILFFIKTFFRRFVQKYVQDMSNSSRANTRTLPEWKKKFQYIFKMKAVIVHDCKTEW